MNEREFKDEIDGSYDYSVFKRKSSHIARISYQSTNNEELTLLLNDLVDFICRVNDEWWYVRNLRSKEVGYVPARFLSAVDELESKEYVFLKFN